MMFISGKQDYAMSSSIEKDGSTVEEYTVGGVTYYLFENLQDEWLLGMLVI